LAGYKDGQGRVSATFRGVPFQIVSVELTTGRRTQPFNRVKRTSRTASASSSQTLTFRPATTSSGTTASVSTTIEAPYHQDLGREGRSLTVNASLVGDDYMARRDALIAAVELDPHKKNARGQINGPGEFVCPYHGVFKKCLARLQDSEKRDEGGRALLTITFVETADAPYPARQESGTESVQRSADEAMAAVRAEFAGRYDLDVKPSALDSIKAALGGLALTLRAAAGYRAWTEAEAAAFWEQLAFLQDSTIDLLSSPEAMADAILAPMGAVAARGHATLGAFRDFGADFPTIPHRTPSRETEDMNRGVLCRMVRAAGAIGDARAAAAWTFARLADAAAAREEMSAALAECLEEADDEGFAALADLRARTIAAIVGKVPEGGVTSYYLVPRPTNVILLAWEFYGDAARCDEIAARNPHVRRPGFVPAGTVLELAVD